ncbi:PEGA domain-containing protein [Kineothrix sp. MB12-C1]|uniref:PEGA domain-containing protein n=1 Tax=Kineothrix sp. MB12-C1 TaxID=3070215 RepID=UPI0027D20881|nr:PEGA domain-containing protein [Kineothrix sp. MB12-C1]WMC91201.1 PEGA domain-containing protein [Kineothrix sp. MB12-C1]
MGSTFFKRIIKSKPVIFTGAVILLLTAGVVVAGGISVDGSVGMAREAAYESYDSGFVIASPGTYDSVDTALIETLNTEENNITFLNIETGRSYTLSFDGTTVILDKYGSAMAMSQMKEGDIVDVTFLKAKKRLTQMKLSESAWIFDQVEKYNFDVLNRSAEIGSNVYNLRRDVIVISEGKEAQIEDIIKGDVVTISGIGNTVYSVTVEKGHGYLRLSNEEYLKGGWIEVGQSVISQIQEDMLLAVPEGTYDVHLTASGIDEIKRVTIYRNQEITLDVSDVKAQAPKVGKIIFAITPGEASVYIDGQEVDISGPVEIEYGVHQMIAKAEGYDSITQYIKVGQELASISVTLEEAEAEAGDKKDSSSVSGNELTSSYRVYIDSPSDVEVYLDGVYVGMSPVNFKKEAGTHMITLRKEGYVTKSYTISIDEEEKDVTYSFTDLVKEDSVTVSGNAVPGNPSNSVSGNATTSGNSVSGN